MQVPHRAAFGTLPTRGVQYYKAKIAMVAGSSSRENVLQTIRMFALKKVANSRLALISGQNIADIFDTASEST